MAEQEKSRGEHLSMLDLDALPEYEGRVFVLNHPLVRTKLTIMRDKTTHHREFRNLANEVATALAWAALRDARLREREVETPLAVTRGWDLDEKVGLVPILRAGLGLVDGVLSVVPNATVWPVGIYRDEETLQPITYYEKLPPTMPVSLCLVLDPMLATGGSAAAAIRLVKERGVKRVKYLGLVGAPEGVRFVRQQHPDVEIYLAALDSHLTPPPQIPGDPPAGYIVPGLGDAGDRLFGT